jgi:hypothetical protein
MDDLEDEFSSDAAHLGGLSAAAPEAPEPS